MLKKKITLLTLSLLGFSAIAATNNCVKTSAKEPTKDIIVMLNDDVDSKSIDELKKSQNKVLATIGNYITAAYEVNDRFYNAFNGIALNVPESAVDKIESISAVKDVSDSFTFTTTIGDGIDYEVKDVGVDPTITASAITMNKPENSNEGAGTFIAVIDESFYLKKSGDTKENHEVFNELTNASDAVETVDTIAAKITAAGDSFHGNSTGSETYWNNKVPYAYDYAGDSTNVYGEMLYHGTHVASLTGGNETDNFKGVASRAQLALMKVSTTSFNGTTASGTVSGNAIIKAIDDAIALGVDVITVSIGNNLYEFDTDTPFLTAVAKAKEKGIIVNFAAGNEGKEYWGSTAYEGNALSTVETGILGSYTINDNVTAVASCEAVSQYYDAALVIGDESVVYKDQITDYTSTTGAVDYEPERYLTDLVDLYSKNEFEFYKVPGLGTEADYAGLDLTNKIAIVDRGEETFRNKVDRAIEKGAIAVGIIDTDKTATEFSSRMSFVKDDDASFYTPSVPVIFILNSSRDLFGEANNTGTCQIVENAEMSNPRAGTLSTFSSEGTLGDLSIKPEITAPGSTIKGASIDGVDKYVTLSGTSMATPNYSGACALALGEGVAQNEVLARFMSTATPLMEYNRDVHERVRKQGAGLVNITAAVNTDVYLTNINKDGSLGDRAKIELKNNDDIKQGKINLSFGAVNKSNADKQYTAKTYIYKPATNTWEFDETDTHYYTSFNGLKYQTTYDELITTVTQEVTIPKGSNTITLNNYELTAEQKAAIAADYDQGCIIEGYTILEPAAQSDYQLSIPFLGYYGDLDKVSPVEPFDFEKKDNTYYDSMGVEKIGHLNAISDVDNSECELTSMMLGGYMKAYSVSSAYSKISDAVAKHQSSLRTVKDDNDTVLQELCVNPYTGEYDPSTIYVGNNGYCNTIFVQQFVTRSVYDNTITITKKGETTPAATNHFRDGYYGEMDYEDDSHRTIYPLLKSFIDSSFWEAGYLCHTAWAAIPLGNINSIGGTLVDTLEDGEYTLSFNYVLMTGSTYTKSYNLVIDSSTPTIKSRETVSEGGIEYYRVHYSNANMGLVTVAGVKYEPKKETNGCYVDIPKSAVNGKAVYQVDETLARGNQSYLTRYDDENELKVSHSMLTNGVNFTVTYETKDTDTETSYTMSFSLIKNSKAYSVSKGKMAVSYLTDSTIDWSKAKVYEVTSKGVEREISSYTVDSDGRISLNTGLTKIVIKVAKSGSSTTSSSQAPTSSSTSENGGSTGGCGANLTGSIFALMISLALLVSLILKKKYIR